MQDLKSRTSRRRFLTLALAGVGAGTFTGHAKRVEAGMSATQPGARIGDKVAAADLTMMVTALRAIGTPVCLQVADRLQAQGNTVTEFDLHLRSANLDVASADRLARGIDQTTRIGGAKLRSFSASYNPELSDAGVMRLCDAFPGSLTELGLVGCELGDVSGSVLLDWASQAPSLRMICIEDNDFSDRVRSGFRDLSGRKRGLFVVV